MHARRPASPCIFVHKPLGGRTRVFRSVTRARGTADLPTPKAELSPILRTAMDVQDFDGVSFHRVDHHARDRRKRKFSCAAAVAGSAPVGCVSGAY